MAAMVNHSEVVTALIAHGVDPLYPVRFIDDISREVLEERTAQLSEITIRMGYSADVKTLAGLMALIGGKLAKDIQLKNRNTFLGHLGSQPWKIRVGQRNEL